MTAASQSVTWLVSRGWAKLISGVGRMLRRWERFLIVLAVCLPVPALAATGLSIPLPATVERLAAALVPWADAANLEAEESLAVGAEGAIVLARHELAETQQPTALAQTIAAGSRTATSGGTRPEKEDGDTGEGRATSGGTRPEKDGGDTGGGTEPSGGSDGTSPASGGGGSGSGGSGGGDPGESSGGSDPGGSSGPVETVIEETGSATEPVVDAVEDTVDDPVGTVGDVVEGVGEAAGGLLPRAGP